MILWFILGLIVGIGGTLWLLAENEDPDGFA